MSLDLLIPDIFESQTDIESYFTLANRNNIKQENATVNGLHLGAFSHGEDPTVKNNYSLLFESIGWDPDHLAIAKQVHGSIVKTINAPGIYLDCDGLVTDQIGLAIGIQVADCAAILLYEPKAKVIAALHAGWRGTIAGIINEGIKSIVKLKGNPKKLVAFISPCISLQNFEVGPEVANQFPDQFCDYSSYDKPHVDLSGFLEKQLINEGLKSKNIEKSDHCTFGNNAFFSYRRERDKSGRMLALIKMNN
tara:strand:+ start:22108 stop:22857 length:750 start_codon:yes stop_codon:yes gene_type:complete